MKDTAERLIDLLHAVETAGVYDEDTATWTGGAQSIDLSFNGVGPFAVPVGSMPAGFDGSGFAALAVQLTTGPELVTGLLDAVGNPIPDGWTFPAVVFVIDSEIYDILAFNPYLDQVNSGIVWWASASVPTLVLSENFLFMPGLPTSDPAVAGALWNDSGIIHVSAG